MAYRSGESAIIAARREAPPGHRAPTRGRRRRVPAEPAGQCCRILARNCCARSVARLAEEVVLGRVLDDAAVVHEDHPVRDLAGEAHLVRHHHHRHAVPGELDHDVEHLVDHLGVERGGGLVEQHADRVHRQRAGDRHPLLLAAGELAGKLVLLRLEADPVEELPAALDRLVLAALQHLDLREGEVLRDRQVRKELEVLEHHADARAQLRQVGLGTPDRNAVDGDLPLLERLEAIHALDQRRLARPRRPADDDDLALLHAWSCSRRAPGRRRTTSRRLSILIMRDMACPVAQRTMAIFFCSRFTTNDSV